MIRLPLVERVLDPALGVAHRRDLLQHREDVRGRAAVQRARERPDRRRERGPAVGSRRGDDARGEGRGVQSVLGRADPVGVDRLHVSRIRLAAPAEEELLGSGLAPRDDLVGDRSPRGRRRRGPSARRSPSSAPRGGRGPRAPARPRSRSACPSFQYAGEARGLRLEVGRRVSRQPRRLVRLGIGHLRRRGRRRRGGPRRSRTDTLPTSSSMSTPR